MAKNELQAIDFASKATIPMEGVRAWNCPARYMLTSAFVPGWLVKALVANKVDTFGKLRWRVCGCTPESNRQKGTCR